MNKIQYITQDNTELSHSEQALAMFKHGVKWVQLRMKKASVEEIALEAKQIMVYAEQYDGLLILNDDVTMAKELGVKAVHVGLNDMPINEARQLLGSDVIIGGTANTFEQIKLQIERGADYVGVGPYQFTTTKKNLSPTVGLSGYTSLLKAMEQEDIKTPLFAVGGIGLSDISQLKEVGVEHFAISGAMLDYYLKNAHLNDFKCYSV